MLLGYARVSTIEQAADNRTSLEEQQRIIQSIAMARGLSHYDVQIYVDKGISGGTALSKRPEGGKLFMDAKKGDIVCASKLDRLFRDTLDAAYVYDNFKNRGVDLILFDMGNESVITGGMSKAFFGIMSIFADMERGRIAERMMVGKRAKKARGGHIGGKTPFGWKKIGEGREARLELDQREQEIIREVVSYKGLAYPNLAHRASQELFARGIASRNGKPFKATQIYRIWEHADAAH